MKRKLPKLFVANNNIKSSNFQKYYKISGQGFENERKLYNEFDFIEEDNFDIDEEYEFEDNNDELFEKEHFLDMDVRNKILFLINLPRYVDGECIITLENDMIYGTFTRLNNGVATIEYENEKYEYKVDEIKKIELM